MADTKRTVSLDKAAAILGVSKEALRKRISRQTLEAKKNSAGHWEIDILALDRFKADTRPGRVQDEVRDSVQDKETIARLESDILFLRSELERKDTILMAALQKVPAQITAKRTSFFDRFRRKPDDVE